jgi:RHS repeat-associated protein
MRQAFLRRPATRGLARLLTVSLAFGSMPIAPAAATPLTGRDLSAPAAPSPAAAPAPAVHVNRIVPAVQPVPALPAFSDVPTEDEITHARVFGEPLLPVAGSPSPEENKALAAAITSYLDGGDPEALSVLAAFGAQYPQSPWWPSVLAGIGVAHRRTGYFSRAATELMTAWQLAKDSTDNGARATADHALSNLLEIHMQFGQLEALDALLAQTQGREVRGGAAERLRDARATAWGLRNAHEHAVPSGPVALGQLLRKQRPEEPLQAALQAFHASPEGASIAEIQRLAQKVGLRWRIARRQKGASVVVPSLLHLRSGHFSALVAQQGDRFVLDDPLVGGEVWLSRAALEDEASGYFLIPDGPLASGWTSESRERVEHVRGKCVFPTPDGNETGGHNEAAGGCGEGEEPCEDEGEEDENCASCGAAQYRFHAMLASLNIHDTPIHYRPPRGPAVAFRAVYSQRESSQPQTFYYSNMGSRWTFNWLSYVEDNPANESEPVSIYLRGGGKEIASGFSGGAYAPTERLRAVVVRTSVSPVRYERRKANGWVEVFEQPDGAATFPRRVFMTQVRDPQGNAISMTYDSQLRLVAVTDSLSQVTTLSYELSTDPLKLTKVTDPFGRVANLHYDPSGQLVGIKDVVGLTSTMSYGLNGFVASLTTPHGTTAFSHGVGPNAATDIWVQARDPFGAKHRAEYVYASGAVPSSVPGAGVPSGFGDQNLNLNVFNGFYFSKGTMAEHGGDYAKAAHTRWMRSSAFKVTDRRQSALRPSLGGARVWYGYRGGGFTDQVGPDGRASAVARVFDDGTSRILRSEWNVRGKRTRRTDAVGRTALFGFAANGIDRVSGKVKNGLQDETLWTATYNSLHRPLTITDAAGQTVALTWNGQGQIETILTPPRDGLTQAERTTTFAYDTSGFVQSITGPLAGTTLAFTYDGYGRVRTVTDSDSYTLTLDYDALNRPTKLTYPDGTYEEVIWDRLNPGRVRDRLGRWSHLFFDSLRRLTSMRDPSGATVSLQWCPCGGLDKLVDANGNATRWERDGSGRVTKEIRANGSFTEYAYEGTTNRVKEMKDPKGQITRFEYFADDQLKRVTYPNIPSLPDVSFTYDASQGRLLTMTDGTGTTNYTYYAMAAGLGAGQLQSVDGPLANDTITFTYDELRRPKSRSVDGVSETVGYDALGRLTSVANALGSFGYTYDALSDRLTNITYPNGQQTDLSYFGASGQWRLQQILHKKPGGALLSRHAYTYSGSGNIKTWVQETDTGGAKEYEFGYDGAERLTAATLRTTAVLPTVLKRYVYAYDKAGNRTSEQIDSAVNQASHNTMNQTTQIAPGGTMRFAGTTNEEALLTVAGKAARAVTGNGFEAEAHVGAGATQVEVKAADGAGNLRTNTYQVSISGSTRTLTYDDNGNLLSDGIRTYEWDPLDQLTAVNQGTHRSDFTYDGEGRRVRMVEKENGATVEDRRFVWDGTDIVEERNAGGIVVKRYLAGGIQQDGTSYYIASDHLDSLREMTDATGASRARYDFDGYGRRTKTSGDLNADFGFAGTLAHGPTGLSLAVYRGYDPGLARWLNQDPIGLGGGLNLYAYAEGNPIGLTDPLGLDPWWQNALNSQPIIWLTMTSDFWAGVGDNLTFGTTSWINSQLGNPMNRCSTAFKAGGWAGIAWGIAMGGAGGWRLAGSKGPRLEFSHWVPSRLLQNLSSFWRNRVGKSRLNGNFVSAWRHFKHDPFRFPPGWQQMGNKFPTAIQQLDRIPWVFKLAVAGGAWGGSSMWLGSSDCP